MQKSVFERIEDAKKRGLVLDVYLFSYGVDKLIGKFDAYDAKDKFGDRSVMKRTRNKTTLRLWIV